MLNMLIKVKAFIEKFGLIKHNDHLLIACSGGPDSLALIHVLLALRDEYAIKISVAHVNHMFRGAAAHADAVFVGQVCAAFGLDFFHTAINVPEYIDDSGRSPQDAARILRYGYLRRAAAFCQAKIVTGHHMDDQAETVLLNLLRGAGSSGLAGMKPVGGGVIRPFLEITREEIEAFCVERNLTPRLDGSNLKTDYLRNYLRLELMPLLRRKFNANLSQALCRTAWLINDERDFVAAQADKAWRKVAMETAQGLAVNCRELGLLHVALRREIIRQAIMKKQGELKGISFFHVEKLLELAFKGTVGSVIELPGRLVVKKGYGFIEFLAVTPPKPTAGIAPPGIELDIAGVTFISELDVSIAARVVESLRELDGAGEVFDLDELQLPVRVRTRIPGDSFRPAGGPGSKKLKDFFIDKKVPREQREQIPLVCDNRGILWVVGYRRAERALPASGTKRFLELTLVAGGLMRG